MDVAELAQTEPIPSWRVHIAVHRYNGAGGRHFKRLPNLNVHLKISDGAPVVRRWGRRWDTAARLLDSYKNINPDYLGSNIIRLE